jgi:hypothetical protein
MCVTLLTFSKFFYPCKQQKNKLYRILIIDRLLTTDELNTSIDDDESEGKEIVCCAE